MDHIGYVDIHAHIIPDVDDGSRSLKESVKMLGIAYEQGIRKIYATPHYNSGKEKYDRKLLLDRYESLRYEAAKTGNEGIEIILGNEIYYGHGIVERLEKKEIFTMGESMYILVEFNYGIGYNEMYKALQNIVHAGYRPILAHIERYYCLYRNVSGIGQLRELGVALQINADSVMSRFDSQASFCRKLIRAGYIQFLGSDCHSADRRMPIMRDAVNVLRKKTSDDVLDKILFTNPDILSTNGFL